MKNWMKLVISIALPLIAGGVASQFTVTGEGSWYANLQKPDWNPPGWVFGPVWTTLYILMGIAFFLIWKAKIPENKKRAAIAFWIVQLIFNFFWSIIFFDAQQIYYAFMEIVALWVLILTTIILFYRINKTAAGLMIPYLIWVSFATVLNYKIMTLNT